MTGNALKMLGDTAKEFENIRPIRVSLLKFLHQIDAMTSRAKCLLGENHSIKHLSDVSRLLLHCKYILGNFFMFNVSSKNLSTNVLLFQAMPNVKVFATQLSSLADLGVRDDEGEVSDS